MKEKYLEREKSRKAEHTVNSRKVKIHESGKGMLAVINYTIPKQDINKFQF